MTNQGGAPTRNVFAKNVLGQVLRQLRLSEGWAVALEKFAGGQRTVHVALALLPRTQLARALGCHVASQAQGAGEVCPATQGVAAQHPGGRIALALAVRPDAARHLLRQVGTKTHISCRAWLKVIVFSGYDVLLTPGWCQAGL